MVFVFFFGPPFQAQAVQGVFRCRNAQHSVFTIPIPAWLKPSAPAFHAAVLRGDPQALFEAEVLKNTAHQKIESEHELVARLTEMLDEQRVANPDDHRFIAPVIGYGNDRRSRLVGLLPHETPKRGETIFPGLYPVKAYHRVIADGKYPMGDLNTPVTFFGLDMREQTAHHGLAHYGGFYVSRDYSDLSIKMSQLYLHISGTPEFERQRLPMGFFGESLWFPDIAQGKALQHFLESLALNIPTQDIVTVADYRVALEARSDSQILDLAKIVIKDIPEITPLGGGSRDYSEKDSLRDLMTTGENKHVQNQALSAYRLLTDLSLRDSIQFHELRAAATQGDILTTRELLAVILTQAHLMPQMQMKGWFEASAGHSTEASKKVLDLVCQSGVFNRTSSIFRIYCK